MKPALSYNPNRICQCASCLKIVPKNIGDWSLIDDTRGMVFYFTFFDVSRLLT